MASSHFDFSASFCKIISLTNNLKETLFNGGISVVCCYDPEGIVVKLVKGNQSSRLARQHFFSLCLIAARAGTRRRKN